MSACDILTELRSDGLTFSLRDTGLFVSPRLLLTEERRAAIRTNRSFLIAALESEKTLTVALVESINHCCEARGDDDANRAALIEECCQLTLHEQADMREHFEREAANWRPQSTAHQAVRCEGR